MGIAHLMGLYTGRMPSRPSKRLSGTRANDRRAFSLMVHGAEFGAGEELVINPDCFPDVKVRTRSDCVCAVVSLLTLLAVLR
jgi:hypothetical protein